MDQPNNIIIYPMGKMPTIQKSLTAEIDGKKNTNLSAFYKHLSNAFKFPDYFGNNLDSLDEVLNDFSWVDDKNIAINISNSDHFLSKEKDDDIKCLLELFSNTINEWKNVGGHNEGGKIFSVYIEQSDRMDRIMNSEY